MKEKDQNTESKILSAARDEFIVKGMAGARMQEIANRAGINKALLHYYYRSKEKLFMSVFRLVISKFIPNIEKILQSNDDFLDKIRMFVNQYGNVLLKNQFLPLFILHEINRNPKSLVDIILSHGIKPAEFFEMVNIEIKKGRIKPIDPRQIIINMLSLIIFPIAGRPLLQRIIYNNDKKQYDQMLKTRLEEIPELIINSIKK
ncbi:MAG: TetR/AcrR family transcriptional regulator [Bacteroidales bacterium]|nr:TetR/AcrR family transcriptional regulator [Bacteroidales bacterium]